jgi:hypothetical protein
MLKAITPLDIPFFDTLRTCCEDTTEEIQDTIMEDNQGFNNLGGGVEVNIHAIDTEDVDIDDMSDIILAAANLSAQGKLDAIYVDSDLYSKTYYFLANPQNLSLSIIRARFMDAVARQIKALEA